MEAIVMGTVTLADRVAALEAEVARLRAALEQRAPSSIPWTKQIAGTFENDPLYDEAMRLGRKYRDSTRPKPAKRKKRTNGRS
jgi:hypothetical protein